MPTYEYECPTHGEFEETHSINTKLEHCPQCKEAGTDQTVKRLISLYNLDMIIAIGYRVNSNKATQFRIWATGILREYLKNGYALQKYKLNKSPELIEDLQETLNQIASNRNKGKVKGKLTFKITKDIE